MHFLHPPDFLLDIHEPSHNEQEKIGESAGALNMFLQK